MKRLFTRKIACFATAFLFCWTLAFSQTNITGKVIEASTNEPLTGVSIQIKGKIMGTITGTDGKFNLVTTSLPPFTISVSSVGFETQEINVTSGMSHIDVKLTEQAILGKELVVSASRVEESVMRSAVSIEKIDIRTIRETPQVSFYDALQNLKGIEMNTQSLTFKSVSTRGIWC